MWRIRPSADFILHKVEEVDGQPSSLELSESVSQVGSVDFFEMRLSTSNGMVQKQQQETFANFLV